MQNRRLLNILNSILVSLLLLTCGITFIFNRSKEDPPVLAEEYELIEGVDATLGKVNRFYSGYSNNEFTYSSETSISPDELATLSPINAKYEDPQFTMLNNAAAEVDAAIGGDGTAENIYFTFGKSQEEILASNEEDLTFIIDLNITITRNGTKIYRNEPINDTETIPATNGFKNVYFIQFLDLTRIYTMSADGTRGTKIEHASGLYEIEIGYEVQRIHRTRSGTEWQYSKGELLDPDTMKYAFYLLDESDYTQYPEFDATTVDAGNNSDNGTLQYFYNYNKYEYPTYNYDANKYNVKFTKTSDKLTREYESTFVLNGDDTATLTFTNIDDSTDSFTKIIHKVDDKYPVTLNFTEQGIYTITNRYVVDVYGEYVICNNLVAESYLYPEIDTEGDLYRSQYKLHIFGFTATFNNDSVNNELLMLNNGSIQTSNMLVINETIERTIHSDISYLFTQAEMQSYNGSTKLLEAVEEKLDADFANFLFASTDQPPIKFDYVGEYKYTGIRTDSFYFQYTTPDSITYNLGGSQLFRKDDYIEDPGYYELILNYTYSEYSIGANIGSQITHTQAFIFTISNTSPSVTIENQDGTVVNEYGYTNQSVYFNVNPDSDTSLNDNYFNAPISVILTKSDYKRTSSSSQPYTQGQQISDDGIYNMTVKYGLDGISKDTYEFIIDKNPISGVKPQAVEAITELNSDDIIYYQFMPNINLNEYYNKSTLFNQPFALLFDEKDSGARIDVTYRRYYFEKNMTAGTVVNSVNGDDTFITTNYELNLSTIPQTSAYAYDFDMYDQSLALTDSVFDLDTSCLILFYLKDLAGNEFRYYVIYDLTIPYVNVTPEIENDYNIVSTDTTVTWGDHKAIKLKGGDLNSEIAADSDETFSQYIDPNDQFIKNLFTEGVEGGDTYTYLTIPINQIYISYLDNREPVKLYYVKDYNPTDSSKYQMHVIDSIAGVKDYTIYPMVDSIKLTKSGETNYETGVFAGENDISYNISDKSHISMSNASIKNDNSFSSNIWMNLDKSLGLAFVKVPTTTTSYGMQISEDTPITANQLRFSYIPGEADFAVDTVTYDYYEVDASSYRTYIDVTYENGEPKPYFPYAVTPALSNQTFSLDSSVRITTDVERKFSEIINQENINGQTYTKSGMYVFKRVYEGATVEDKVRYYIYFVDRQGIIDINAELLNDERITYEQGYGFVFNFSNDGTKFTALQVQQYLASILNPSETNLFSSNKLPITFDMPFDKFNTRKLLKNSATASAYKTSEAYTQAYKFNEYNFGLNTSIMVVSILDNNTVQRYNYTTADFLVDDLYTAQCKNPGIYTVTISDKSGYSYNPGDGVDTNYNCNKFSFRFEISHSAPKASYHTKDISLAVSTKASSNNSVNYQEHVSTNSKLLQLSFEKNTDPYLATINASNFRVYKNSTVIFSMTDNVARLNGQVIYTITDDVPLLNGVLETTYAPLFTIDGKVQNNQTFEIIKVGDTPTAYLNGEMVYEYINGVYRAPNGTPETKFSPVFKDRECLFKIENKIGTLDGTKVFELTNNIPMHGGKIATEYSKIFVYDEATNKYIITLFNANDPGYKYITDYLTEATYKVELNYEGDKDAYAFSYTTGIGTTANVNFYQKQFAITVDHTAPEYNLNQLISSDKFHKNKNDIDTTQYFFAVDSDFVFVKQNELETNELFYRYLGDVGPVTTPYEFTITPDHPAYSTGELSNHNRFNETAMSEGQYIYKPMYYGRITESLQVAYGYYEIIERDEALNYRVYAIYYNGPNTEISFSYDQADSNGIQDAADENLSESPATYSVKGAVLDKTGAPIEGITVKVQNTEIVVSTDNIGEFFISDLLGIQTLEFISADYSFIPATKRVNQLNYSYDEMTFTPEELMDRYITITAHEKIKGTLKDTTPTLVAEGQNLKFTLASISTDYYMRAEISGSNGFKKTVINRPDLVNIPAVVPEGADAWEPFVNQINEAISTFSTTNSYGYTFDIEFINRYGENFNLKYVLPGIMLDPAQNVDDISSDTFSFAIPTDPSGTTYIRRLEVRVFSGGDTWSLLAKDLKKPTPQTINTFNDGKPLNTTVYYFSDGEYMFTLTDNFNRTTVYYKGAGVDDERTINYGSSVTIGGITYTASSVELSYQTALYRLKVVEINPDGTRMDITSALKTNGVTEVSNVKNIRKLEFQNNEIEGQEVNGVVFDGIRQFEVSLFVEKLDLTYTYRFIINRTNPKIELKNLSGEKLKETSNLEGNPTIHTEDFLVSWNASDPLLFNPKVKLTRTYYEDNQQKTEVISNLTNGYRITKTGTYKAEIYNSLGFSDPNKTIYFRRIDGNIVMYSVIKITNSMETELQVSNDMPNIYIGGATGTAAPLYKYYALKHESTVNEVTTTTYDLVEIRVNPSKGLICRQIVEADEVYDATGNLIRAEDNVYRIYGAVGEDGTVSYGYDQYIQLVYILASPDFVSATIATETHEYASPSNTLGVVLRDNIKNTSDYIDISFPGFNSDKGNPIYLSYSFNGIYVETISNTRGVANTLRLTNAGVYSITLFDLAGNVQEYTFSTTKATSFTISLINDVLYTVNGETPIQDEIFNSTVVFELINKQLYDGENVTISAKRNGKDIKLVNSEKSYNSYVFEGQGYYTITLSADVTSDLSELERTTITTEYNFAIINPNQAQRSFNIPLNQNFTISKVLRENVNITHNLSSRNELWLSAGDETTGSGIYTVTVNSYIPQTKSYKEFTFKVWINDEMPVITSDLDFGDSTTKEITISFNKNLIYQQIGDSIIRISGMSDIIINEDTATQNVRESVTLVQNIEYTIQVLTADGKVISSYKLTKKEPLNTVSIIVIVIVSIVVIGLVVTFIILRKHIRFR